MKGPKRLVMSRVKSLYRDRLKALWFGHQIHGFPHGTGQNLQIRAQRNAACCVSRDAYGRYVSSFWHVLDPIEFERGRNATTGTQWMIIPVIVDYKY